MIHTYKIEGMTCGKCVNTVKTALGKINGVEMADISLNPPQAILIMNHHIDTNELNTALKNYGHYSLVATNGMNHEPLQQVNDTVSFFVTYKPILLVFAYLLLASILKEIYDGGFNLMNFMQVFMGGFFLIFSFFKMLDIKGFASSYMSYDIIAKKWFGWGYVYPFVELLLGLAYLFHFQPALTNIVTVIVMSLSIIGVIQSLLNKQKIQCACLGTIFNLPMSKITLIEDALMIMMAAISFAI